MPRRGQVALSAALACAVIVVVGLSIWPGSVSAQSKVYTWTDASGRIRISDRPPQGSQSREKDVKAVRLRRVNGLGPTKPEPEDREPADVAPSDEPADVAPIDEPADVAPIDEPADAESGDEPADVEPSDAQSQRRAADSEGGQTSGEGGEGAGPVEAGDDKTVDEPPQDLTRAERIREWRRRALQTRRGQTGPGSEARDEGAGAVDGSPDEAQGDSPPPPTRSQRRSSTSRDRQAPEGPPAEGKRSDDEEAQHDLMWNL